MRVAFFTETFLPKTDGVVTRLRYTMEELARAGDEMFLVAPRYSSEGPESYAGAQIYRVPGITFPPYPQLKLSPTHPGVGRALKRFKPDLIHVVNPFILGPGGVFYAYRMKVPLVASYHTNVAAYGRFYGLSFMQNVARMWTKGLHNQAVLNLCTSEATMGYLLSEGIKRVRLWPQGVDSRRFRPDRTSPSWRRRLSGGHPEEKLLLFVGRLAREKHIERLKAVLEQVPGTRLGIVGNGPARRYLEREFAGTPTTFVGMLQGDDLADAYASGDVFLFPSTTETLGLAMLEAMASGLPVVAARGAASHEVVEHGQTGLLYEADSPPALVEAVRRLVEDDALRVTASVRARAAAEGRDWEAATNTLRDCYGEVLAGGAREVLGAR